MTKKQPPMFLGLRKQLPRLFSQLFKCVCGLRWGFEGLPWSLVQPVQSSLGWDVTSEWPLLWVDEILHHVVEIMENHFLLHGICRGIIIPGFLRWWEMDFVHPQYDWARRAGLTGRGSRVGGFPGQTRPRQLHYIVRCAGARFAHSGGSGCPAHKSANQRKSATTNKPIGFFSF